MDAIANVSAAPQRASTYASTYASSTEIASQLSAAAIDADEGIAKQMLATLLRSQLRRSDEPFQSQLGVLEHVFLTLRSMALTDDLTTLYNRRGFLRAGTRLLSALSRDKRRALLFYIDVDGLKSINDSAGHAAGDSMLTRTAQVLRAVFRDNDVLGRLGGDEFAALVPATDPNAWKFILHRLQDAVAADNLSRAESTLSLSVGFARFNPGKQSSISDLLRKADMAMYENRLARRLELDFNVRSRSCGMSAATEGAWSAMESGRLVCAQQGALRRGRREHLICPRMLEGPL
jgi:diguanylate cyclase (GGDEF)-like protein